MSIDNIADLPPRVQYTATAGQDEFPYTFPIFQDADLVVDIDGVVQTIVDDYTVSGATDDTGGFVTLTSALAGGEIVTIYRETVIERTSDFPQNGPWFSAATNDELDRLTTIAQEQRQALRRSIRFPMNATETDSGAELSPLDSWAERFLYINSAGHLEPAAAVDVTPLTQSVIGGLLNPQTDAEDNAGVTPSHYDKASAPLIDAERYHVGTVGNATDDEAAINRALSVVKQSGGLAVIPSSFNSTVAKPALDLSAGQSGALLDLRMERPNSGNEAFGAIDFSIEGRDAVGNSAGEVRVLSKQNPAFTAVSVSDGTATGYPRVNFASSFLHKHENVDQWQMLADPLFGGYYSWNLIYFAGSSGKVAMHVTIDANSKPRFTLAQANLTAATGNIVGASNTSPIVITTLAPHGLDGSNQPVSIASVGGNTAANGDWEVTVLTATTFELNGSTGNGVYTSGGTFSGQQGHSRATLNVPPVQGGTEAIYTEGQIASEVANGTPPITTLSQTPDVNLTACPKVLNINGTLQNNGTPGSGNSKIVIGNISLVAGSATVNLTGDAAFTGANTYKVGYSNLTAANAVRVTRVNGGQFTLTGTGTDSIDFFAIGF